MSLRPCLLACVCVAAAETHYDVLGVPHDFSIPKLKKAYYSLARSLHPDKVKDPDAKAETELRFKRVAEAYEVLSDDARRREYDYLISAPAHQQELRSSHEQRKRPQQKRQQAAAHAQSQQAGFEVSSSMDELPGLVEGKQDALKRNMVVALYDGRDDACVKSLSAISYPRPFIGMSQDWHGVDWADIIVAAKHDVGPSLALGRPSGVLSTYEQAVGRATHDPHGFLMPRCPTFIFQPKGERLGRGKMHSATHSSADAFRPWVFSFLQIPLIIRNECPSSVRVNWIHGSHVKELLLLGPKASATRTVYLSHTLHAESIERKGQRISDNSSLLIFRVMNTSEMVVRRKGCVDLSSDCEEWLRKGECGRHPQYMKVECPLSCEMCGSDAPATTGKPPAESRRKASVESDRSDGPSGDSGGGGRAHSELCVDDVSDCVLWAARGECKSNQEYMVTRCRRACGECGTDGCADVVGMPCKVWALLGECIQNAPFMSTKCRHSCGMCGDGAQGVDAAPPLCQNSHVREGECDRWAADGKCESNMAWMRGKCQRSCGLCECADRAPKGCAGWTRDEQCTRNRRFMVKHCIKSCGWCGVAESDAGKDACYDEDIKCEEWVNSGECERNHKFMKKECMMSCGLCAKQPSPQFASSPLAASIPATPEARVHHKPPAAKPPAVDPAAGQPAVSLATPASPSGPPADTKPACVDTDHRCEAWANAGQCKQKFMAQTCPAACKHTECMAAPQPPCEDKLPRDCPMLARSNDGCETDFMKENCLASCDRCPRKRPSGPASNARQRKDEL